MRPWGCSGMNHYLDWGGSRFTPQRMQWNNAREPPSQKYIAVRPSKCSLLYLR